jgi:hypothetical protein
MAEYYKYYKGGQSGASDAGLNGSGRVLSQEPIGEFQQRQDAINAHQRDMDMQAAAYIYANKTGLSVKESLDLIKAKDEANRAEIKYHAESLKEDAQYRKDFANFRSDMAKIDYQNLSTAGDKINEILTQYSHLAGSHDPEMSKAFESISQSALRRNQSSYNAVARRLPQGVPPEAVFDEKGRPDINKINDAIAGRLQQKAEAKGTEAGLVAGAKFPYQEKLVGVREAAKEKGMEKQSGLKIQTAFGMIPAAVKKQEALIPGEVELAGKKQEAITEASMPKPKVAPTPTPEATPLPSSTPEATTERPPLSSFQTE